MITNYIIFETGSDYWKNITRNGELEVPTYVKAIITAGDEILEERKHPIKVLDKGKSWMVNYSQSI